MPDVGLFVDCLDQFLSVNYLVKLLLEQWKLLGLNVVVTDDLSQIGRFKVALFHYDCTRLSLAAASIQAGNVTVLNGCLRDISKRAVSTHLVDGGSNYDGPVIVKSNRNYGGRPELRALSEQFPRLAQLIERLPWTVTGILDPASYPIYDRPSDVPWLARRNRSLVVEKFLPERRDDLYCLRQYLFCGDREINTLLLSRRPVIKARDVIAREEVPEIPPALRALRRSFHADYGRFDYVIQDGRIVLFDINKTPGFDPANRTAPLDRMVQFLAPGILPFMHAEPSAAPDRAAPGVDPRPMFQPAAYPDIVPAT